ncbi:MAG: GNAT family N-acetyltransferase [Candidatus Aminicenantes bacterium]|nr:GNAT family N-acetyltransferase [Candidatus Aminicenantes bacterium]MDH5714070.1 GNAT family N-acetyltransferase [Candidatus Aminicenantes bacterium]
MLCFRKLKQKDIYQVYQLDQLCFPQGISYSFDTFLYFYFYIDHYSLVAEENEGIIGFIIASIERNKTSQIITLDIHPNYRRRKIGSKLLSRVEDHLISLGIKNVYLQVEVNNTPAISLYKKCGFTEAKRLPKYYLNKIDAFLMKKNLAKQS